MTVSAGVTQDCVLLPEAVLEAGTCTKATAQGVRMYRKAGYGVIALASLVLFGCSQEEPVAGSTAPADETAAVSIGPVQPSAALVAVNDPRRPDADRARDELRKPAEVLEFFGIQPGMSVLDLYSGGGYYTEILSYLVGDSGQVVAHNNQPYLQFSKEELAGRFTDGRLENVTRLIAENNELELQPGSLDAVVMILSYHDIYFVDRPNGWDRIDGPKLLSELYSGLKPGGVLGIVDHMAQPGAAAETGTSLHRLDPEIIKKEVISAGFALEAESPVLRNAADDGTRSAFDPEVRGHTDRVVLRFRKPR